ncbi:SapC family protein [Bosea sp. PAMC 26642]|uniref:SapC family protein n=1 Tax=Bosea sp. (strain PAMC 26642) TaxID=1792307 RepID=UPI0007703F68|nr:SapC family protein [Bosea sp. PAMC 26642]AMJ61172.1 hypothetical protein AXW83_13485 [Bosea sp. PAMC 26642]
MSAIDIQFLSLEEAALANWLRPVRFDFLDSLIIIPLGDTEILHLSHYMPIAVALMPVGPRVVGLVHSALLTGALVTPEWRWRAPYVPMALRCLPFRRPFENDHESVEIAPSLALDASGDKGFGFWDAPGKPLPEFDAILMMLDRLGRGVRRLSNTARMLLAADVLTPLSVTPSEQISALLVASRERLLALPPVRAAALTADSCAGYELATASIFSQRWLVKGIIQDEPMVPASPYQTPLEPAHEVGLRTGIDQPIQMDDSALFSIEAFLGTTDR